VMSPSVTSACAGHDDDLALLVSDDLAPDEVIQLQQHLVRCAACRARLEEYRADAAWLRRQRHTPPDVGSGEQLQARIADQIADRPPTSWTVAWLHRLFEGATRRGSQPLLAGLAAALLAVGGVGALTRPLDRAGTIRALDSADLLLPSHRHVDRDIHPSDEQAFEAEGDDATEMAAEDAVAATEPETPSLVEGGEADDLAAQSPGSMRIEMKTSDPDVRIIWFAQADRGGGSVQP
jgi:anti-sigma factor RsiW